ncbi:hypothetical protein QQF64_033685, partial [Cirrhinus molitorella]
MLGCLKAVCKSSLLLSWAWTAALGEEGADELRPQHNSSMLRSFHLLYDLLSTRPVLRVSREKSRRETQSQSRSSSTLDQTQGEFTTVPSHSVETRLNATNETLINPNHAHQGFSDVIMINGHFDGANNTLVTGGPSPLGPPIRSAPCRPGCSRDSGRVKEHFGDWL